MSRHLAGTRPPISPGRRRFAARVGLVVVAAGLATACTDSSAMGPAPDDESVLATPEASLTEPISRFHHDGFSGPHFHRHRPDPLQRPAESTKNSWRGSWG
ncbi:hypothetical protein QP028_05085 [Corynebacterium suedekumii]|nr:hypothetical protein QP028_05085 [Corynebacterium suedekumii]